MNDHNATSLDVSPNAGIDIGRPVEWLVDPDDLGIVLGVTYEFTLSRERKTVWYTKNKRKPKDYVVVAFCPCKTLFSMFVA